MTKDALLEAVKNFDGDPEVVYGKDAHPISFVWSECPNGGKRQIILSATQIPTPPLRSDDPYLRP